MRAGAKTHDALPLRTVARLTGLSADLIRAWEKRYGAVKPVRGPRGARLYRSADVAHLRSLARVVASGRAIGDVARLGPADLEALVSSPAAAEESPPARALSATSGTVLSKALEALARFDGAELDRQLGEALLALGRSAFARKVAGPLLEEVGDRWSDGRLSVADEHLVSALMRSLLTGLQRGHSTARAPALLLAAPSGERHEFGLLLTALEIADRDIGVCYMGADLPAAEVADAARRSRAQVVGMSLVNGENRAGATAELRRLERALPHTTELWVGGREARAVSARLGTTRALVIDDPEHLDAEIERLRSHRAART